MNDYSVALFIHLISLLLATTTAAIGFRDAMTLRAAKDGRVVLQILTKMKRLARFFPIATLGLLGSGAFMIHVSWDWSAPWIRVGLLGLVLIIVLGAGIEGARMRALAKEVATNGLSDHARRLQRDPIGWTARTGILSLIIAVMFLMTTKPDMVDGIAILIGALALGCLVAVPFWRSAGPVLSGQAEGGKA